MPLCDSLFGPIRIITSSQLNHLLNPLPLLPFTSYIKPIFYNRPFSHHDYSLRCYSYSPVYLHDNEEQSRKQTIFKALKQKIDLLGINYDSSIPGHLFCPKCHGGRSVDRTLSFDISNNGKFATWSCFRDECGWSGQESADAGNGVHVLSRVDSPARLNNDQLTADGLGLIPLRTNLIAYFAERMISKDVLVRNDVMQLSGNRNVMAFTYKRNGSIVSCKYRNLEKRFWQCVEKIFYGIDDIVDADDIIIVEGEIDKLSMEEAGFLNCISVPDGAQQKLSAEELPSPEKDSGFKYVWNCQEYLNKASRIILATDGDSPGHVLAEELARRLGRERCWRVRWPKKDNINCFNDANEVLKCMGPSALRDIVDKAEPYRVHNFSHPV
ncbi:primase homolog protein isoform X2 [Impatiens glandulifera]|uniref:primase homolog protein isoform X2 n=1 Tax=Impatiens glandulifera TaxID=253017 RepID=UPI001FB08BE5|nr:primase homolog protein isoform X2 [Impatiens glandulifera]